MNIDLSRSRNLKRIAPWIGLGLVLIASGCAGSGKASGGEPEQPLFAGTWEGGYDAVDMAGDMMLILNLEEGTYSGTLYFDIQGEALSASVYNVVTDGNSISFSIDIQGIGVEYKGMVEEEKMTGLLEAYMGGELMGEGTFYFVRKP